MTAAQFDVFAVLGYRVWVQNTFNKDNPMFLAIGLTSGDSKKICVGTFLHEEGR